MVCYQIVECGFCACRSAERHRRHRGVTLSPPVGQWCRYLLFSCATFHVYFLFSAKFHCYRVMYKICKKV